jgi:hypothetical protein
MDSTETQPKPPVPSAKYKAGDKVHLSYDGQSFQVTVKSSTIVGFVREYCIEYSDGSKRYVKENEFTNQLN